MKNRLQAACSFSAAVLAATVSLSACADDRAGFSDPPDRGGRGGAPAASAGALGSAGSKSGAPNAGSTSLGGVAGVAGHVGGGAGAGAGAVAGTGGAAGAGGSGDPAPLTFACDGQVPTQPIITSFDGFQGGAWLSPGNLAGGGYVYPGTSTLAEGDFLRFDDRVEGFAGIGVWFSGCIDASQYKGIRLSVHGHVGSAGAVYFAVVTNRDKEAVEADETGACVPVDPEDVWSSCRAPVFTLPVTGELTTHEIPWSAFQGGLPTATTDGSDLLGMQWSFEWGGEPYAARLTIDDLAFMTEADP